MAGENVAEIAPEPPRGPVLYASSPIPELQDLKVFSIRNGPPEAASSLLIRATIPPAYHWTPIVDMPPSEALKNTDAYISTYLARSITNPIANLDAVASRKAAICMGVARAVSTTYYEIGATEIMPGERADPLMRYHKDENRPPRIEVMDHVGDAQRTSLTTRLNLTEVEKAVVPSLILSSLGIVPLQGYSLMNTQHHYLSDAKGTSRRAFMAVERQFWKHVAVAKWFDDHLELIQDIMWHKACHPVNLTVKYMAATSEAVKQQLITAGAGSAATRLPALETDVKAATSYQTLFNTVKPMFAMYSGRVETDILDLAIATVQVFPPGIENPKVAGDKDPRIPANVMNRRTALKWLGGIVNRNAAAASHCFGFYCAMLEQGAMTGGGTGSDTLRAAFSLMKLKATHMASYTTGHEQFADYLAARMKARKTGTFEAPIFEIV